MAAEAIFGWGCKHFPRALRQRGPPGETAPSPFFNAVFTDTGVFFKSCQSPPQLTIVVSVQTQLQKYQSAHRCTQPFYLQRSLKVTGSNIEQEIVAHAEELRHNRRRQNTHADLDLLFQHRFDLQTSPFGRPSFTGSALKVLFLFSPYSISQSRVGGI